MNKEKQIHKLIPRNNLRLTKTLSSIWQMEIVATKADRESAVIFFKGIPNIGQPEIQ